MANIKIKYEVDSSELQKSEEELKQIKKNVKGIEPEVEKSSKSFKDLSKETQGANKSSIDLKSTIAKLGIAAAVGAGIKAFVDLNKEIIKNRKEAALLTGETGKALDIITAKTKATAQTFDKEFNETLRAANTFAKEFDISVEEALDNINEGFVRGLDVNGEYLDSLREYSSQVKSAGLDQKEFIQLLETSVQEGIFSDKGIDVVKEAALRIRELTPAASQAMDAIGISSKQIEKDLREGTRSVFDVIKQVSAQMATLPPQSKEVGTAIADIFGGPGEDAGLRFITLLKDIDGNLGEVTGETGKYVDSQRRLLESQENVNMELVNFSNNWKALGPTIGTFLNTVGAGALRFLNDLIEGFISTDAVIDQFEKSIKGLSVAQLERELESLKKQQEELGINFNSLGTILTGPEGLAEKSTQLAIKIAVVQNSLADLSKQSETTTGDIDKLDKATKKVGETFEQFVARMKGVEREISLQEFLVRLIPNIQIPTDEEIRAALMPTKDKFDSIVQDIFSMESSDMKIDLGIDGQTVSEALSDLDKFNEQKQQKDLEQQEFERGIRDASIDAAAQLGETLFEQEQLNIQRRLDALAAAHEHELALAGDNARLKENIDQKYTEQRNALVKKQAEAEKKAAIFRAIINTATAIISALTTPPAPLGIALAAIVGALGAFQIATISSQQVPTFNKGTKRVPGTDTTKDSVHAILTPGEGVMPVNRMNEYRPAFEAMFDRRINPKLINDFVQSNGKTTNREVYTKEVIRDSVSLNVDRHGFGLNVRKGLSNYKRQVNEYSLHG